MAEESEFQTSRYNSGIAIIMRLDALWKDTHRHSRAGFYSKWNEDLDRIWCELARDLKTDKYEDKKDKDGKVIEKGYYSQFSEFDLELGNHGSIKDSLSEGLDEPSAKEVEDRKEQYKILMRKELFLRRLENKLGKGTAWDDDQDGFE